MKALEAAAILNISKVHILRSIYAGKLKAEKIDEQWEIQPEALSKFANTNFKKSVSKLLKNFDRKVTTDRIVI